MNLENDFNEENENIQEEVEPKVQENGQENEVGKLFDATNDIIRRITRYATQLSEKNAVGGNRREEYRKVAEIFLQCENLEEAQKSLEMVMESIENQMPEDFFSIDLMDAYESLGSILGESVGEDLVNEIFGKFCMGK